uniref:Uncharacterized protein n=1 Tax=Glossina palpalis gambiensis TaxID=67801 RepID=A0A1B0BSZ3_9MUSC
MLKSNASIQCHFNDTREDMEIYIYAIGTLYKLLMLALQISTEGTELFSSRCHSYLIDSIQSNRRGDPVLISSPWRCHVLWCIIQSCCKPKRTCSLVSAFSALVRSRTLIHLYGTFVFRRRSVLLAAHSTMLFVVIMMHGNNVKRTKLKNKH